MGTHIKKRNAIARLPDNIRAVVDQMILANEVKYSDVVEYLRGKNVSLNETTVCRYARDFYANIQTLQRTHDNFRIMMEEMDKYPSLDTTEGIVRVMSQHVFQRLANATPEELSGVPIDKLMGETNALIRAVAYKRRTDIQNEDIMDVGLEKVKTLLFDTMAREQPDLYKQVTAYINGMKSTEREEDET